jgi:hypothetical protein
VCTSNNNTQHSPMLRRRPARAPTGGRHGPPPPCAAHRAGTSTLRRSQAINRAPEPVRPFTSAQSRSRPAFNPNAVGGTQVTCRRQYHQLWAHVDRISPARARVQACRCSTLTDAGRSAPEGAGSGRWVVTTGAGVEFAQGQQGRVLLPRSLLGEGLALVSEALSRSCSG